MRLQDVRGSGDESRIGTQGLESSFFSWGSRRSGQEVAAFKAVAAAPSRFMQGVVKTCRVEFGTSCLAVHFSCVMLCALSSHCCVCSLWREVW